MLDHFKGNRAEDFRTPREFMEFLWIEFKFSPWLDACASDFNHLAPTYYTKEYSCLDQEWFGDTWINPPYGRAIVPFLEKCNEQIFNPDVDKIFALLPARTDTKWFHDIVLKTAPDIYFIKGRFKFKHKSAVKNANAPFASMLVIYHGKKRFENMSMMEPLIVPKEFRGWKK
jgi:phage N-6-adenine-methyltransferase